MGGSGGHHAPPQPCPPPPPKARELQTLHNLRKLFVQDVTTRVKKVRGGGKMVGGKRGGKNGGVKIERREWGQSWEGKGGL